MIISLNRYYELTIRDLLINTIRCQFVIDSGFNKQVKKGTFTLFNLSEESYNKIIKDEPITFSVIDDNGGKPLLFQGLVVNKDRKTVDDGSVATRVLCWSGGLLFRKKKLNVTFSGITNGNQVLTRLREEIKPLSIAVSDVAAEKINNFNYKYGTTLAGTLQSILREFSDDIGETSTLDNNDFFIGSRKKETIYISSKTGNLIGTPSVNIGKTELESSLIANAIVGGNVDVESKYFTYSSNEAELVDQKGRSGSGEYEVQNFTHEGDTHSEKWLTKWDLRVKKDE